MEGAYLTDEELAIRLLREAYRGHDGTGLCLFRPLPADVAFPDRVAAVPGAR